MAAVVADEYSEVEHRSLPGANDGFGRRVFCVSELQNQRDGGRAAHVRGRLVRAALRAIVAHVCPYTLWLHPLEYLITNPAAQCRSGVLIRVSVQSLVLS